MFYLYLYSQTYQTLKILKKISVATNLIKNLSYSNEFTHENTKKTVKCLTMFSRKMLEYNVTNYRCVATEACRQVINSDFFTREVKKKTGLYVEIISANEEAKLCFQSCKKYVEKTNNEGILFDIGGGSTEIYIYKSNKHFVQSFQLGGVRLMLKKDEISEWKRMEKWLKNHKDIETIIGLGGNVRSFLNINN